jgi:hypothetical protein
VGGFFYGDGHHNQKVKGLLIYWYQTHNQCPILHMNSTKKLPCFLSKTKKKSICQENLLSNSLDFFSFGVLSPSSKNLPKKKKKNKGKSLWFHELGYKDHW